MDQLMFLSVVGLLAAIGIASFIAWDRHQMCTAEIEGSLGRVHAKDIKLKLDWLDFDRDTFTYDVEYCDPAGKVHHNRCKVATRYFGADNSVYWTDPIESRPSNTR